MSKAQKIWLIVAISLVAVGSLIFAGSLAALDFDFTKLGTQKYETNTYEVSGDFDKISIDVTTTEIVLKPSDDETCRAECFEQEKLKHSVTVQDGILIIDTVDTRKWFDHIGMSFGNMKMTVYLPRDEYTSLTIDTVTGDVEIAKEFAFQNIKVSGSTADVICCASASNIIEIDTDTGDINVDTLIAGEMMLSTATGKIGLTDVNCTSLAAESNTGNISLKNVIAADIFSIENDTGDVRFENSDAASISVRTSTGDVTGTLLSEKIFITKTSTGDVSVPKTITGGRCEITTDTGNIEIDIQ